MPSITPTERISARYCRLSLMINDKRQYRADIRSVGVIDGIHQENHRQNHKTIFLTMIFLVYAINYADRTNIGAVLPFIIDEFHINNFEAIVKTTKRYFVFLASVQTSVSIRDIGFPHLIPHPRQENKISFCGFDDDFPGVCHQLRRQNEYRRGTAASVQTSVSIRDIGFPHLIPHPLRRRLPSGSPRFTDHKLRCAWIAIIKHLTTCFAVQKDMSLLLRRGA
jgi:hypothetical protein